MIHPYYTIKLIPVVTKLMIKTIINHNQSVRQHPNLKIIYFTHFPRAKADYGHLVAIVEGDRGYLGRHDDGETTDRPVHEESRVK